MHKYLDVIHICRFYQLSCFTCAGSCTVLPFAFSTNTYTHFNKTFTILLFLCLTNAGTHKIYYHGLLCYRLNHHYPRFQHPRLLVYHCHNHHLHHHPHSPLLIVILFFNKTSAGFKTECSPVIPLEKQILSSLLRNV